MKAHPGRARSQRRAAERSATRAPAARAAARPAAAVARSALWPGAALLGVLTLIAYGPAFSAGFIWDDDAYVVANRALRSLAGLWDIWTRPGAVPQYYPLTFTSFWLEYRLWDGSPAGYHVVNALLHVTNAVLVWQVLRVLDRKSTRLNSSHLGISYAVFCLKKK